MGQGQEAGQWDVGMTGGLAAGGRAMGRPPAPGKDVVWTQEKRWARVERDCSVGWRTRGFRGVAG